MVHLATVVAVMPATPGRSLQCCSQQSDRERSGWADRADMKSDWCILSEEIAGNKNARCDKRKSNENIPSYSTSLGEDCSGTGLGLGADGLTGLSYQELVVVP